MIALEIRQSTNQLPPISPIRTLLRRPFENGDRGSEEIADCTASAQRGKKNERDRPSTIRRLIGRLVDPQFRELQQIPLLYTL